VFFSVFGDGPDDFNEFSFRLGLASLIKRYECETIQSKMRCGSIYDTTSSFLLDYRNSQWATTAKFKFRDVHGSYCDFVFTDFNPDESMRINARCSSGTDRVFGVISGKTFEDAKAGIVSQSNLKHVRYADGIAVSIEQLMIECQIVVPYSSHWVILCSVR
jgi:hypothetical protein